MTNPHDLAMELRAAGLFPPHDSEPARLRDDITDELADHLSCAIHHELLQGVGLSEARRRALDRFGDPQAIAKQLYRDSMKGILMTQKLTFFAMAVIAVLCCSMMVMMWRQSTENQALVAALIDNMEQQATGDARSTPPEWANLTASCSDEEGNPVAGVKITIEPNDDVGIPKAVKFSDDAGQVDFGVYRYGHYIASLERELDGDQYRSSLEFSIHPGQDKALELACPLGLGTELTAEVELAPEETNFDWRLDESIRSDAWVVARLHATEMPYDERQKRFPKTVWSIAGSPEQSFLLFISPTNMVHVVRMDDERNIRANQAQLDAIGENRYFSDSAEAWSLTEVERCGSALPSGAYRVYTVGLAVADQEQNMLIRPSTGIYLFDGQVYYSPMSVRNPSRLLRSTNLFRVPEKVDAVLSGGDPRSAERFLRPRFRINGVFQNCEEAFASVATCPTFCVGLQFKNRFVVSPTAMDVWMVNNAYRDADEFLFVLPQNHIHPDSVPQLSSTIVDDCEIDLLFLSDNKTVDGVPAKRFPFGGEHQLPLVMFLSRESASPFAEPTKWQWRFSDESEATNDEANVTAFGQSF